MGGVVSEIYAAPKVRFQLSRGEWWVVKRMLGIGWYRDGGRSEDCINEVEMGLRCLKLDDREGGGSGKVYE